MRKQFTFYESFFSAISRIKKKTDRADAYDIICAYALNQVEPDLSGVSDAVAIVFELLRPVLDKAKAKSENGQNGAGKPKANRKQNESKPETNESKPKSNQKQTVNEKEGEIEIEVEVEREVEKEKEVYIPFPSPTETTKVCAALPGSPTPVAMLPLADGTEYAVLPEAAAELQALYPAVDVTQELRNMRGWSLANPKNRKTLAGIMRFVNAWLAREQNRSRPEKFPPRWVKPEIPKGASGVLGDAELEAIRQVLAQDVEG